MTVDLFFLRATIGSTGRDDAGDLPTALAPIAKTSAANGFAHVSLMAPIRHTCRMERDFGSQSCLRTNPTGDNKIGDDLEFTVRGGVRPTSAPETVELTIEARIEGHLIDSELIEVGDIDFSVDATIAARFGQYVILSAAPGSTAKGQAVAVVVRVTDESAE